MSYHEYKHMGKSKGVSPTIAIALPPGVTFPVGPLSQAISLTERENPTPPMLSLTPNDGESLQQRAITYAAFQAALFTLSFRYGIVLNSGITRCISIST